MIYKVLSRNKERSPRRETTRAPLNIDANSELEGRIAALTNLSKKIAQEYNIGVYRTLV